MIADVMINANELCKKISKEIGPMETEREHKINDIIIGMCAAKVIPRKEFHWFENFDDIGRTLWWESPLKNAAVSCGFYKTNQLLHDDVHLIISDQSHFFSQYTIDCGYILFAHFTNGKIVKVYRGMTTEGGRLITEKQNLEKLLLAGEFYIK